MLSGSWSGFCEEASRAKRCQARPEGGPWRPGPKRARCAHRGGIPGGATHFWCLRGHSKSYCVQHEVAGASQSAPLRSPLSWPSRADQNPSQGRSYRTRLGKHLEHGSGSVSTVCLNARDSRANLFAWLTSADSLRSPRAESPGLGPRSASGR